MTAFLSGTVSEAGDGEAAKAPDSVDGTVAALDAGVSVGGTAIAAIWLPAPIPGGGLRRARGSIQPMTTLIKPTAKTPASPPSANNLGRRDDDDADGVFARTMVWATLSVCGMGATFTAFGSGGSEDACTGSAGTGGAVTFSGTLATGVSDKPASACVTFSRLIGAADGGGFAATAGGCAGEVGAISCGSRPMAGQSVSDLAFSGASDADLSFPARFRASSSRLMAAPCWAAR
ncbi:MAG: hypothetical protein RIS90_1758 [Pseudomonadota bacterium]